MNHESIKKQNCPVKFWYHHPAVPAATGAEFLQTPDGKLYCRVGETGSTSRGAKSKRGTGSPFRPIARLAALPHSPCPPAGIFTPVELDPGETKEAEAAALVELTTGDKSEQFWLGRNPFADAEAVAEKLAGKSEQFGGNYRCRGAQIRIRKLQTSDGSLITMFAYERPPLGFSVKLVEFHRDTAADSASGDSCVSQV